MKTKPFSELRKQMTPERRARNKTRAQIMSLLLTLVEMQNSLEMTQDNKENAESISQLTFSQLESQDNILVSTLSSYINVLGGSLKLVAHFPDGEITLAHFD